MSAGIVRTSAAEPAAELTARAVARELGVSRHWVASLIRRRILRSRRVGTSDVIHRSELMRVHREAPWLLDGPKVRAK